MCPLGHGCDDTASAGAEHDFVLRAREWDWWVERGEERRESRELEFDEEYFVLLASRVELVLDLGDLAHCVGINAKLACRELVTDETRRGETGQDWTRHPMLGVECPSFVTLLRLFCGALLVEMTRVLPGKAVSLCTHFKLRRRDQATRQQRCFHDVTT